MYEQYIKKYGILFSLICSCFSLLAQHDDIRKEINKIIRYDTEISYTEVPGFIVGIIDQDTNFVLGFGEFEDFSESQLNHILFEGGSLTKLITSALCQVLKNEEKISFSSSVNSYLPASYQNPRLASLTLEHLINHYSGFPKRPKAFGRKEKEVNNPYKFYTKSDLLRFYTQFIPSNSGHTQFLYSHLNYAMIELVLEYAMQSSYDSLVKKYVFDPLQMNNSFFYFDESNLPLLTQGHNRGGMEVDLWDFQSFAASEGVKSTMHDLLKFLRSQMDEEPAYFNQKKYGLTDFNKYISIAQGWYLIENKEADIYAHSGKTNGHYAYFAMVKETRTGVVILANSALGTEDLGYLILRMINYNWNRKK